MRADFLDAHQRHLADADHLLQAGRLANADHLYGMASECGLKRLMLAFGMAVDTSTGSPKDWDDKQHANVIWARYETYRSGHHQGTGYPLTSPNPFGDWKTEQRYAHQRNFDAARVQLHQAAAQIVRELIKTAQREGLI